ncbi:MAG: hypothetical protein EBU10_08390 [Alphaproteobacteria bacterium]|nr:hypothetical protein [Alphaproteobacteria bacterium]
MQMPSSPSLDPILHLTKSAMASVNAIIVERMQSDIDLIPTLAGHLVASGGKRIRPMLTLAGAMAANPMPKGSDDAVKRGVIGCFVKAGGDGAVKLA